MKPLYIVGLLVIAVAISIIFSTTGDASTYVTFKEAQAMAADGNDDKIHVVGTVKKDAVGQPVMHYNPAQNPNLFRFTLVDDNQEAHQVVYHQPKPQDFERSDKVVIIGAMQGTEFVADKILLKCPSKYNEGQSPQEAQASAAR